MVFPDPDFLKDKNCNQYLFFAKFIKMLNRNYVALSMQAHDQLLNLVSDACEAFYQSERSSEKIEELYKEDIKALTVEV